MDKIVRILQTEMEKPGLFSLFHILWVAGIIAFTVLLCILFKDCKKKTFKTILLISWIVLIIFEILKQITRSFHFGDNGDMWFEYDHYHLPFHLCSAVYYVIPVYLLLKDENSFLYKALTGFISTYFILSGLIVVIYNSIVMTNYIFINIQTMLHHGLIVTIGCLTFTKHRQVYNIKYFFKSLAVLAAFILAAIIINILITPVSLHGIDMFYLNPLQVTSLPVAGLIQEHAGFIPYLLCYLIVVFGLGMLIYAIESLIIKKNKSL